MSLNFWMYLLGNLLHMWLKADAAKASPNSTINSYAGYFNKNKAILAVRFVATTAIFVIFVEGGAAIFGEAFMPNLNGLTPAAKAAVCVLIGLAADSILDKVMVRLPFLQNEIPPAPNGASAGNAINVDPDTRPERPPRG